MADPFSEAMTIQNYEKHWEIHHPNNWKLQSGCSRLRRRTECLSYLSDPDLSGVTAGCTERIPTATTFDQEAASK
jgi:hypothetical protein